ncbi:hypothetical protein R9C00_21725 [Flammeovirgaceae bacterium SG7u.111]|nr:hypothetical protein [Flammeovirgaceae bacterium SG7u.132]WPO34322.1 hypothetical protein R9C00_21725 [Flammeovirgaceae bacterium SG7u.111]
MAQHTSARVGNQSDEKVRSLVKAFLKQRKTAATKHEIVTETGLSVYDVEDALEDFIGTYQCVLKADADHNLSYKFDFSDVVGKKDFWKEAQKLGKKLAKWAFMGFITFMLFYNVLVYFPYLISIAPKLLLLLFFLGLFSMIAFYFYAKSEKEGGNKNSQITLGSRFQKVYRFFVGRRMYFYLRDKINVNVFQTIFSFAFGENKQENEVLEMEKRVLTYVKNNNNILTLPELIMLTGWDTDKADKEITKFMYHYEGNVTVNEDGVLIYHFPHLELEATTSQAEISNLLIWNDLTPRKDWNNNYIYENGFITVLNAFILSASAAFIISPDNGEFNFLSKNINIHFLPLIFSITFFAIFIYGKWKFKKNMLDKLQRNRYYLYLKKVFSNPLEVAFKENCSFQDKAFNELDATFEHTPEGNVYASFHGITNELETVGNLEKVKSLAQFDFKTQVAESPFTNMGKWILKKTNSNGMTYILKERVDLFSHIRLVLFFAIFLAFVTLTIYVEGSWVVASTFLLYSGFLFLKQASQFINSTIVDVKETTLRTKSKPFPFAWNQTFELALVENLYCRKKAQQHFQLAANVHGQKFTKVIAKGESNETLLWEIATEIMEWKEEHQE